MKKIIYGVSATVLAIAGVAASKAPSKTVSYYWAYTTATFTHLDYKATPPPTAQISGCGGINAPNCSQSAASFTKVGTLYEPKGSLGTIFKTNL